jgi:hypothetical protein
LDRTPGAKGDAVSHAGTASPASRHCARPGNSGSVVRTLKDTRLADPISAEDTDNHSTESYVLSIADYGGRALRNYRYGPVIMHNYGGQTYGVGASGNDAFEYGGAFDLPGKAFHITGSNIP